MGAARASLKEAESWRLLVLISCLLKCPQAKDESGDLSIFGIPLKFMETNQKESHMPLDTRGVSTLLGRWQRAQVGVCDCKTEGRINSQRSPGQKDAFYFHFKQIIMNTYIKIYLYMIFNL